MRLSNSLIILHFADKWLIPCALSYSHPHVRLQPHTWPLQASAWASARTSRRTSAMNDDAQSSFGGMDGVSVIGGGTVDGRSVAADTDLSSLLPEEEVADLTVVKGLDKALQVMERALAQNVFHSKVRGEGAQAKGGSQKAVENLIKQILH